uniref:EamA domain-containing protein n=1 Tax=Haptolina brevifila TaxID=156173 RepID=A0A7S2JN33_9EUKA|mmetsp:Transcript_8523/g.17285  ORF Transcript_8523/g.17285 Transcript_8523/m.17285 type:complete len:353 (+) Transcript_8523:81-1139(+)|eukprot:CAMPEP_0174736848 /NCGR_PEP_ID=MMETSP1094-20130205/67361_1 /TAXON_ID=156173 /ORGANISM="Chrysochromulina brevifilum, Strain UTEX LB 985" /LENGTH=352 /DNA_ID=CAMNT_0015940011 /DNA_START=81 /DNA_END=1139 /DNA_ORIENTATION=+
MEESAAPKHSFCQRLILEHSAATASFSFLVAVGVLKTLLTKLIFTRSPTPVAFSVLSCLATNICLLPILLVRGEFTYLSKEMIPSFVGICFAIALDLGCQNVALAILSIALQQSLKATLPTATVVVESIVRRKTFHWAIYVTVAAICVGPILVACQSSWQPKLESAAGSQVVGAIMMLVAMVGGAFKYVLCHKAIKDFREQMGVLAFTFWVEVFVGLMLLPWAVINGEVYKMVTTDQNIADWVLLWFTAAFGGVRIIAQFYFLANTSATSLAISGIAMQALTIVIGIFAFGTPITALLVIGVTCTVLTSSLYTYLKTSIVLKPTKPRTDVPARVMASADKEDRIGLKQADDA